MKYKSKITYLEYTGQDKIILLDIIRAKCIGFKQKNTHWRGEGQRANGDRLTYTIIGDLRCPAKGHGGRQAYETLF